MRVHLAFQDCGGNLLRRKFHKGHFHRRVLIRGEVCQRHVHIAVLVHRDGLVKERHLAGVIHTDHPIAFDAALHKFRILMMLVHVENMIGGRQNHLRPLRQNHGLQHIDHLCDTRHLHPVTVLVENI